jgi:hypothetical protein
LSLIKLAQVNEILGMIVTLIVDVNKNTIFFQYLAGKNGRVFALIFTEAQKLKSRLWGRLFNANEICE